ncbi:uncharacterized protein LAJ45_00682 [Morchella importuna]|uniref:uncharacterized protein n=1 Tax=Morchella importuna TaxID=1174673 RepID=UPI001E8DA7FD|nr:uncharacterized protein LAJ45_00682 [Morchella importuna]KAH8155672.1 hypothetical protein LAJ45_00682 [Morchella importuna]
MPDCNFIRLTVAVLPYPYGKKGSDSLAARFATATPENNFEIDENQPYGEIWMGDHPNGPSRAVKDNKPLADIIASNPEEYLTSAVYEKFNKDPHLPFLFKILSFRKALPLQAHPDKGLAQKLMKQEKQEKGKNEKFVDPNHKPEVSVTVSDLFQGFVGFRPVSEIKLFLQEVPELRAALANEDAVNEFLKTGEGEEEKMKGLLKTLFWSLFKRDKETISKLCQAILGRMHLLGEDALGTLGRSQNLGPVVKKMLLDYPEDVGMFAAIFFTNFVRLKKGEGIAIPADCIHAYLEGDVIECMAWSDNMIACGFGENDDPKIFTNMLLYEASASKKLELKHQTWSKSTTGKTELYEVPMPEFDLLNIKLEEDGEKEVINEGIAGPSVFLCFDGEVSLQGIDGDNKEEILGAGQAVFIKPNSGFSIKAAGKRAEMWAAFVEA